LAGPYAEVIGDPIGQSRSPLIHNHWLQSLEINGRYVATQVRPSELAAYLSSRRGDPEWRGCNVTIPHKEMVLPLLDALDPGAERIGAVNCIIPSPHGLTGLNTDVAGIDAALSGVNILDRAVALIGSGGAARAALHYLIERSPKRVSILARDTAKALPLAQAAQGIGELVELTDCDGALAEAALFINATPLGMNGVAPMPPSLLASIGKHASGKTLFDIVYAPVETEFLALGRSRGARVIDGLTMLIGQAKPAFCHFFGASPPVEDAALREIIQL
jgi:shikimate dehydrogenase